MFSNGPTLGGARSVCKVCRTRRAYCLRTTSRRQFSTQEAGTKGTIQASKPKGDRLRAMAVVGLGAVSLALAHEIGRAKQLHAEALPPPTEMVIEKSKKKKGTSKEETRDSISSQHLQVKRSWENPGIYAWGSNSGRVPAPYSDETHIKNPRRIAFFDGQILRDLKLSQTFAAAISENGDLYQWGVDFSPTTSEPTRTLRGKDLVSVALSNDRVIALSSSGTTYSLPVSKSEQESGPKVRESSWIPFWPSRAAISYRPIRPELSWSERVTTISSGLEHLLLLTSKGRVFSAASSTTSFPSRGQMGIPGLTWMTRPDGLYDQPHELGTLRGFNIKSIATGDFHSLVLDSEGRVFGFGDNAVGQLGQQPSAEINAIDAPSLLPISRLYAGSAQMPFVTSIAAGGFNSFFAVDASRVAQPGEDTPSNLLGRITADTWSCGEGIRGQLGTGRWTHVQGNPAKIKALSGLFEYDESSNEVIPIRMDYLSVGATHAAAVMANVTHVGAHAGSSENDTNWGADVVWWGGNEYYQLGTGKRNNCAQPVYIGPLDGGEGNERRDAHRFHLTPRKKVKLGGRWVNLEQRVECGRHVSAVYSGT